MRVENMRVDSLIMEVGDTRFPVRRPLQASPGLAPTTRLQNSIARPRPRSDAPLPLCGHCARQVQPEDVTNSLTNLNIAGLHGLQQQGWVDTREVGNTRLLQQQPHSPSACPQHNPKIRIPLQRHQVQPDLDSSDSSASFLSHSSGGTCSGGSSGDFVAWNIPREKNMDLGAPASHWDHPDTLTVPTAMSNYPKTTRSSIPVSPTQLHHHHHQHHRQQPAVATVKPMTVHDAGCTNTSIKTRSVQPQQLQSALSNNNNNHVAAADTAETFDSGFGSMQRSAVPLSPSPVKSAVVPELLSNYCSVTGYNSQQDLLCLVHNLDELSKCGFYYSKLSMPEAKKKLARSSVGTFLLRDSSDPRFLFSLSIRTGRGTTSIRIAYRNGRFLLDCEDRAREHMPSSDSVIGLVQSYVVHSASQAANTCVFLESNGRRDTPVILRKPRLDSVSSLKHLARKSLNHSVFQSPVPDAAAEDLLGRVSLDLQGYMNEYKYCV